ncbi:MAG: flagellar motor switch protein FliM, partial [Devosia sp.]|nr:flagellar motor switch protein FliM [Devosia sp.]
MAGPGEQDKLSDEWGLDPATSGASTPATQTAEDDMGAEWAAMLEADSAEAGAADRVLNQDEIDSLLGFDPNAGGGAELTGVQALINSALVSYERLPMLEIVFDRLVRLATTSLRNFTSDNVEVALD